MNVFYYVCLLMSFYLFLSYLRHDLFMLNSFLISHDENIMPLLGYHEIGVVDDKS